MTRIDKGQRRACALTSGGGIKCWGCNSDGDGKADIVWENTDGSVTVWLMNGTVMSSGSGILGPARAAGSSAGQVRDAS